MQSIPVHTMHPNLVVPFDGSENRTRISISYRRTSITALHGLTYHEPIDELEY